MTLGRRFHPTSADPHPDLPSRAAHGSAPGTPPVALAPLLRALFRTAEPVLALPTPIAVTREIALRAGIEHRALVLITGPASEALAWSAESLGKEILRLVVPPGRAVEPAQLQRFLAAPEVDSVVLVHAEGTLGVQSPLPELARVVRAFPELHLLVDASHSLGAAPLETDAWGLDLVLAGSEGALALPPGLSFVASSPRLLARARSLGGRGHQLDLVAQHEAQVRGDALLPLSGMQRAQLAAQLQRILHDEGLEARWRRHAALAAAVHAWVQGRPDVELLADSARRAAGQSCLVLGAETNAGMLMTGLAAAGWHAGTGETVPSGRHLPIGHMGEISVEQLQEFLSALETLLPGDSASV